ncbi:hypothetical protein KM92DES2_12400 [uncultured Desulfovibrio sp.]|uniref:Uncharacterized protein n=1 Tax=uncultured Desulfovibrio sp. TaxID=167968 RepID=A0A212K8B3_9BACT|nr:hypothetical protein KM92DES2_12400 [uncultured Desulfovibrio sp.]
MPHRRQITSAIANWASTIFLTVNPSCYSLLQINNIIQTIYVDNIWKPHVNSRKYHDY